MKGYVHAILGANSGDNETNIWNTYQLLTGQGIMGTRGSQTNEWNKVWRQIRDRVSNVGLSIRQVISPT
ncbi:hypothetical protein HanPSC8_Chr03g0108831 [Helianthus annuus]|nr:hypothetical protein HanPSC8_Chr03g0108831 [Helianthus annuus]